MGEALESMLRDQELSEPLKPHTARLLWAEVVGEKIASASAARAVRSGVLFVSVRSSVWANELAFYKLDILDRLNERIGQRVLTDIHFKVVARLSGSLPRGAQPAEAPDDDAIARTRATGPLADAVRRRKSIDNPAADEVLRSILERAARTQTWKREHGWKECASCAALYDPDAPQAHPLLCGYCQVLGR